MNISAARIRSMFRRHDSVQEQVFRFRNVQPVTRFGAAPAPATTSQPVGVSRLSMSSIAPLCSESWQSSACKSDAHLSATLRRFSKSQQLNQRSTNPMQKVLLIGYLGRDPEVKYSTQGTAIAQFSLATTERWKDKSGQLQEHTEWFAIKAFGRRAEVVGDYLHKGSRVFIEGRKRTESWDDKQTGGKHYRDLVYADKVEFLDSKGAGNGNGQPPAEAACDETTINDSEIPF